MKKLIALLLAACLMLGLMTTAFAADEKSNDIVILYTNDVHCAVDDNIGYAGLAAYKKEMQAAYNYVALVDCGDRALVGAHIAPQRHQRHAQHQADDQQDLHVLFHLAVPLMPYAGRHRWRSRVSFPG